MNKYSRPFVVVLAVAGGIGCSRGGPPEPAQRTAPSVAGPSAGWSGRPRYGGLMEEIGRRFELAGRAARARRFELAAFEAGELGEVFEDDLPHAELPREGSSEAIRTLAQAFATEHPKALVEAAAAKDVDRFADAFARAADACNACHQTTGHGFVEVPREPGRSVPDVSPASASAMPVGTPKAPASAVP